LKSGSNVSFAGTPTDVVLSVTDADSSQADVLNISISADATADYRINTTNVEKLHVSLTDAVANNKTASLLITDAQLKELVITAKHANVTYSAENTTNDARDNVVSLVDGRGLENGILTFTGSSQAVNGATVYGSKNADAITGTSQGDSIVAGAGNDTVTGGGGNDIIDISGGGANVIRFADTGANNGKDTITGFNVGTAAGADKLDFNTGTFITFAGTLTVAANLTSAATLGDNSINIVNWGGAIADKNFATTNFTDLIGAGKVFSATITGGHKQVVVIQGTDQTQAYYVNGAAASATTIEAGEIVFVGVLSGVTNADTFVGTNFVS